MKTDLEQELTELFDIKKSRLRDEKRLNHEVLEAQKEIRLVTLMFSDDIPDLEVDMGEEENLLWDSKSKRLMYVKNDHVQFIEGSTRENIIKVRDHLQILVKKAKEHYIS